MDRQLILHGDVRSGVQVPLRSWKRPIAVGSITWAAAEVDSDL